MATCATFVVIFLHGLGDAGASWRFLPQELKLPMSANLKYFFPDAPSAKVTVNGGMKMPSWFDLEEIPIVKSSPDFDEDIIDNANRVLKIIDEISAKEKVPHENIIIGGFSQGAVMALMSSVLSEKNFAGVIMLSGWVPMRSKVTSLIKKSGKTPLFHGHGEADNVVTFELAKEGPSVLKEHYDVSFNSYPGVQHSTNSHEMHDLSEWVKKIIS